MYFNLQQHGVLDDASRMDATPRCATVTRFVVLPPKQEASHPPLCSPNAQDAEVLPSEAEEPATRH